MAIYYPTNSSSVSLIKVHCNLFRENKNSFHGITYKEIIGIIKVNRKKKLEGGHIKGTGK